MADQFEYNHPGQKEPRAHSEIHHENRIVYLNTALEEIIADLPMVGPERARQICENRPFSSLDEVDQLEGFGKRMVDDLKNGGAQLDQPE